MNSFSFYSSTLYESDFKLFKSPCWFNDHVINFCIDFFQHIEFAKLLQVRFIHPATSFIIMHEKDQEDLKDLVEDLELSKARLIFLPVNDSSASRLQTGGSHWSLLVFDSELSRFFSYDSGGSGNLLQAKKLAANLSPFLLGTPLSSKNFVSATCPAQTNAYDCGVYAVCFAEFLAQRLVEKTTINDEECWKAMLREISPKSVSSARETFLNCALKARANQTTGNSS